MNKTKQKHVHTASEYGRMHNDCRVCHKPGIVTLDCGCAMCEEHDITLPSDKTCSITVQHSGLAIIGWYADRVDVTKIPSYFEECVDNYRTAIALAASLGFTKAKVENHFIDL